MPDIEFECIVHEVKTLPDYGARLVLDMPEGCALQVAELVTAKELGLYLHAQITGTEQDDTRRQRALSKGRKRKPEGAQGSTD